MLLDPSYDDINPNRKQPFMVDSDGTTVFESLAINLYLVREHGRGHPLAPRNNTEEAALVQWTVWAMTELDPRLFEGLFCALPNDAHPLAKARYRARSHCRFAPPLNHFKPDSLTYSVRTQRTSRASAPDP